MVAYPASLRRLAQAVIWLAAQKVSGNRGQSWNYLNFEYSTRRQFGVVQVAKGSSSSKSEDTTSRVKAASDLPCKNAIATISF